MRLLSLGPEPSASANSAIRAGFVTIYKKKRSVKEFITESAIRIGIQNHSSVSNV